MTDLTDWQADYDPDQGNTGICPSCSSDDVSYVGDPRTRTHHWECNHCGYYGDEE